MTNRLGTELLGPDDEVFTIVEFLGSGYFGEVFKAVGKTSGTAVAVKMLPADGVDATESIRIRSFLNEQMGALLQIRHPNVVTYLYIDEGKTSELGPYIMLEYVDGGTLFQFLKERRDVNDQLPLTTALRSMVQIALGAQAINEHLVHRDIKPDNILLVGADERTIKIGDFGIAKRALERTRQETFKGIQHLRYMAPEVIRREENTTKIDIYSVGLVFYEVLTLQHPLVSQMKDLDDPFEWQDVHLHKQCADVRTVRPEVSRQIAWLLLRMTDKSPNVRPTWDEVLTALASGSLNDAAPIKSVDQDLVALMERTAEIKFQEERERSFETLQKKKAAQDAAGRSAKRTSEVKARQEQLLSEFDEIIVALNSSVPDYPFVIQQNENVRKYVLPSKQSIVISLQPASWVEVIIGDKGNIRALGVMAIEGALSYNLVLRGPAENVFQATWTAIGATVSGIVNGDSRMSAYTESGVDAATIEFMENFRENMAWQRDVPKYFAFRNLQNFFVRFTSSGLGLYNFRQLDLHESFKELVKMALKMP